MTIEIFLEKHKDKKDIKHVEDFLHHNPETDLSQSYIEILELSKQWVESLNNRSIQGSREVKFIKNISKELRLYKLIDQEAKNWEGKYMKHCVSSYREHTGIYSIRDKNQIPKVTFEIKNSSLYQLKGKKNGTVSPKYSNAIEEALNYFLKEGLVEDVYELDNAGFIQVSNQDSDYLETYFEGHKVIKILNHLYINTNKKFRLVDKPSVCNDFIFNLLSKYPLCDEALKPMLKVSSNTNQLFQNANYHASGGLYPLHLLILRNKVRLVNFIFNNYTVPEYALNDALAAACELGNLKLFNTIYNLKTDYNISWHGYVYIANINNNFNIVKRLHEINTKSFIGQPCRLLSGLVKYNNTEGLQWWLDSCYLKEEHIKEALIASAEVNNIEPIKLIKSLKEKLFTYNSWNVILREAARKDSLEVFKYCIDEGVLSLNSVLNKKTSFTSYDHTETPDSFASTFIDYCGYFNSNKILSYIISNREVDITALGSKWLIFLTMNKNEEIIELYAQHHYSHFKDFSKFFDPRRKYEFSLVQKILWKYSWKKRFYDLLCSIFTRSK